LELNKVMHRHGINIRYLGYVRSNIPKSNKPLRQLVLEIGIGRTAKDIIRKVMRNMMDIVRIPANEPFLSLVVTYFNYFLNPSESFKKNLISAVLAKFPKLLAPEEMDPKTLYNFFDRKIVISHCAEQLGVQLHSINHFWKSTNYVFLVSDIKAMNPTIKHSFLGYFYDGTRKLLDSGRAQGEQRDRLVKESYQKLSMSVSRMNSCPINNFYSATAKSDYAKSYFELNPKNKEKAIQLYADAEKEFLQTFHITSTVFEEDWNVAYVLYADMLLEFAKVDSKRSKELNEKSKKMLEKSTQMNTTNFVLVMFGQMISETRAKKNPQLVKKSSAISKFFSSKKKQAKMPF